MKMGLIFSKNLYRSELHFQTKEACPYPSQSWINPPSPQFLPMWEREERERERERALLQSYLPNQCLYIITAYLRLWVNCDKIMHARWDFDVSNAQTLRVSALDKHQNWIKSALFCHNFRAQGKYAVINLIHTWHKIKNKNCLFICDKWDFLLSAKSY